MTCIVGIVEKGKVYLGGDSAGVGGYDISIRKDKKVFHNDEMIMGFTSSFRMGQLLQSSLKIPYRPPNEDVYVYMCTRFIEAVRKCLEAGGFQKKKDETTSGGTFLVGYLGQLFQIEDDYQVGENVHPFDAVGCGWSYALGVLYELRNGNLPAQAKLKRALEASHHFSAGVRPPFHFVSTKG